MNNLRGKSPNSIKQILLILFSTLGMIASNKNIKQNIRENIVLCWLYETSIKILRQISKAPPPILTICRQNYNFDYIKPIL